MIKSTLTSAILFFSVTVLNAQISGNINYQQNQYQSYQQSPYGIVNPANQVVEIAYPSNSNLYVNVKGLANLKADSYVAIFSVTQVGQTIEEVHTLMDGRINAALDAVKGKPGLETYVDMISFVPVYEYQSEKKIFSKKTYNEVPAGFEVKKNIHVKFSDHLILNEIITALSKHEIYDLVKVDYFSSKLEAIKKELASKVKTAMNEKLKSYYNIVSVKQDTLDKQMTDDFKILVPSQMYRSYQSYQCTSLNYGKSANVNQANKSTTFYYEPVSEKEFDVVINPVILEPVIQVMYDLKVVVDRERTRAAKNEKEVMILTPAGELKSVGLKK